MDGQIERMNASMEQYLWVFINHQLDDWVHWLPLVEFAANNGVSETTKYTPFFTVQGTDPQLSFVGESTQQQNQRRFDADQIQGTMQQIHKNLQVEMRRSQGIQEEGANRGRVPAPKIQVGSKVWMDTWNIRTTRPIRKLDWKRFRSVTLDGDEEYQVSSLEDS